MSWQARTEPPPNNEGYDLICIHPDPRRFPRPGELAQVRVQVKSRYDTDCDRGFPVKDASFDAFSHLNDEYAALARRMAAALARKRPSPLQSGNFETWACGILYALGSSAIQMIFDTSQRLPLAVIRKEANLIEPNACQDVGIDVAQAHWDKVFLTITLVPLRALRFVHPPVNRADFGLIRFRLDLFGDPLAKQGDLLLGFRNKS